MGYTVLGGLYIVSNFWSWPTARVPWQVGYWGEGGNEVEEGPGDDDAVVDVQEEHHRHRGHADTYKKKLNY